MSSGVPAGESRGLGATSLPNSQLSGESIRAQVSRMATGCFPLTQRAAQTPRPPASSPRLSQAGRAWPGGPGERPSPVGHLRSHGLGLGGGTPLTGCAGQGQASHCGLPTPPQVGATTQQAAVTSHTIERGLHVLILNFSSAIGSG